MGKSCDVRKSVKIRICFESRSMWKISETFIKFFLKWLPIYTVLLEQYLGNWKTRWGQPKNEKRNFCMFHHVLLSLILKRDYQFATVGTFTSVLKNSKSLKSHITVEIKVFLHFLTCWSASGTLPLKVIKLGMFLHGLLDHDPGVEDLLQHLWEANP